MADIQNLLDDLTSHQDEYEWLDFKENWFSKDQIGEYISALSNGAALSGRDLGYLIWGIGDDGHDVVGTTIDLDKDIDHEPYKHYLARNLSPSIAFRTEETSYKGQRIVILFVSAAKIVQTKFKSEGYIRIGSSKERLSKFPEWEARLNSVLLHGFPTIVNTAAPDYAQKLSFSKLALYYAAKGLELKATTIEKTLKLRTKDGLYNIMAYILSDQNAIPIRVSVFSGTDKAAPLYSVKEFGNDCILYSMDKILEYGDAINIIQADERGRISERKDAPLFDYEAFHEAVLHAFVHNKWLTLNGPQISVFTDRIEILSHGGLPAEQDEKGFYDGVSLPVNESLASIFLQLRLSERSGRGVPKIVKRYGKGAIQISQNSILVTIPFEKIGVNSFSVSEPKVSDKVSFKVSHNGKCQSEFGKLNPSQEKILSGIRDNPNVTIRSLMLLTGLSEPGVKKNLRILQEKEIIQRIGARKNGYWKIRD